MNKLPSACLFHSGTHFTHIDRAEGYIVLHLNLSYFLFLRQNAPSIMSDFGKVSLCMYLQI